MNFEEVGSLFDCIADYYPHFTADLTKMRNWHALLQDVSYKLAVENLHQFASDPTNKFPPHPGALMSDQTDYHDNMRLAGQLALDEYDHMRDSAVPPTPEQARKVREVLGKPYAR